MSGLNELLTTLHQSFHNIDRVRVCKQIPMKVL